MNGYQRQCAINKGVIRESRGAKSYTKQKIVEIFLRIKIEEE